MRDRLAVARQSAWRRFGRRHYAWFVGFDIARAAAGPVAACALLGAVFGGLWWMWHHLSPGWLASWSALAAGVLLVGVLGRELAGAGLRRRAAGLSAWSGGTVAVLTSVVLLFGASVAALVR